MSWSRVLVDGAVLSAFAVLLIFASLRANPRIWLNDFPPDIRRAVPPKTEAEKRQSLIWGLPFLAVLLGGPLISNVILDHQRGGSASLVALVMNGFGVALFFNVVDLLIVDWLVLCRFTPRFLVIPGTEGMAGYKDYGHHFRGFVIGVGVSALLGVLAAAVVYLT